MGKSFREPSAPPRDKVPHLGLLPLGPTAQDLGLARSTSPHPAQRTLRLRKGWPPRSRATPTAELHSTW